MVTYDMTRCNILKGDGLINKNTPEGPVAPCAPVGPGAPGDPATNKRTFIDMLHTKMVTNDMTRCNILKGDGLINM
jgi:hypothetical protein